MIMISKEFETCSLVVMEAALNGGMFRECANDNLKTHPVASKFYQVKIQGTFKRALQTVIYNNNNG